MPAGDPDGPTLKERLPLPIYVDEDCHVLDDVAACAERAHGINIKLAKSGGIREGIRMAHAGRALGLHVMLGCMLESGLGIALGDDCVVEAGLYVTAGTKVTLPDGTVTKARELSGQSSLLFLRNSVTGAVEARPRDGHGIVLNSALHAND